MSSRAEVRSAKRDVSGGCSPRLSVWPPRITLRASVRDVFTGTGDLTGPINWAQSMWTAVLVTAVTMDTTARCGTTST